MDKKLVRRHVLRFTDVLLVLVLIVITAKYIAGRPPKASDFMEVHQVHVEDHLVGEDPVLIYDRVIHQPFLATWIAKIYPVNSNNVACEGTNTHYYETKEDMRQVTLDWYIEKRCLLLPGQYFMKTTWSTKAGPVITNVSNVFTVFDES